MSDPSCFVSYSWDSPEHKKWVLRLSTELVNNGVDTRLDQWDTYPGINLPQWIETCIRECDFVLLVCTPTFALKADRGEGGTGYEKQIVTGEIYTATAAPKKFVPLLRLGDSLPSYLKSKLYIDFRNDGDFDSNLRELLRHLHGEPRLTRPPLGKKPSFGQESLELSSATIRQPAAKHRRVTLEEVTDFLYDPMTLNMSSSKAAALAKLWLEQYADKSFALFKELCLFVYDPLGLNMSRDNAVAVAVRFLKQYDRKDFATFKRSCLYAYDPLGPNMNSEKAVEFAFSKLSTR